MRKTLVAAAICALVLTGCAGTDEADGGTVATESTESKGPTESTESKGPTEPTESKEATEPTGLGVVIEGDRIEPNGKRVRVSVDEPIRLEMK